MNKKRIIITLISIICVLSFLCFISTSTKFIQGETANSYAKETDVEFDIENDAHLRNLPVFSSGVKSTISKGTHVRVLQELNKWAQITDGTNTGWVVKQNVVTIDNIPDEPAEPTNTVNNQTNTLVSNEVENKPVTNESNTVDTTPSTTTPDASATSNVGKKGVVNVDTARVREAPDGKMVGLVDLNDTVEILAEEGEWYKANIDEYKNCYIAKRLVTIK